MTNKEILQADLLDILFENRNKAYGAYALRKNYNHRLHWALGVSLSLVLLLCFAISSRQKKPANPFFKQREITVITDNHKKIEPKQVETSKQKAQTKPAQIKSSDKIKIVNDDTQTDVPDQKQISEAIISDQTIDGLKSGETVKIEENTNKGVQSPEITGTKDKISLPASDAMFPGGREAFAEFLRKYLVTPDELEVGEKKAVLVRFMVDVDGTISKVEIAQTGGDKYDREVIRVLRKMPKWLPATQNGIKVATWFTQPVTFIGIE
jgi:protein TonB